MGDCKAEEGINKNTTPPSNSSVEETSKQGGAMVQHHGIGKHRTHWTKDEQGSADYMLKALKDIYDPKGIMNTGTIYPIEK